MIGIDEFVLLYCMVAPRYPKLVPTLRAMVTVD